MRMICFGVCVFFVVSLSVIPTMPQSRSSKRTSKPSAKKIDPQIVAAERAWPTFIRSLRQAFSDRNFDALRNMMIKEVSCGWNHSTGHWIWQENRDTRDACIANWQKPREDPEWNTIVRLLSTSPCKIEKDAWFNKPKYSRRIGGEDPRKSCGLQGAFGGEFVFQNGRWLLADLGDHEGE